MKKILSIILTLSLFLSNVGLINGYENNETLHKIENNLHSLDEKNTEFSSNKKSINKSKDVVHVFDNLNDASKFLSSQMVKRESFIKIGINQEYYNGMYNDLFELVFSNNSGSSSEGDYLYWHLSSTSSKYFKKTNYVEFEISIKYLSTYKQELEVDKKVKSVLDKLNVYDASDYEKVKAVHDYIVQNIDYDKSLTRYTAYDAIIKENVVCQGFASLTYKMLKELGVDVRVISGYSKNQAHGWNIVKINNKWYNIDNTWDENLTTKNSISYKYFLKNSEEFDKDHKRDTKFTTPEFNNKYKIAKDSFDPENHPIQNNPSKPEISTPILGIVDISNHWAKEDLKLFLQKGYIKGYSDNTLRPNNTITKAEFIKIVNEVFNINSDTIKDNNQNENISFLDVPKNSWYYNDIMNAVKFGYIGGDGNFFNPEDDITREEVAKILTNINSNADTNLNKIFAYDDWHNISPDYRASVEGALKNNYISGYSDNTLKPQRLVTRAEAIVMLNRIKNK